MILGLALRSALGVRFGIIGVMQLGGEHLNEVAIVAGGAHRLEVPKPDVCSLWSRNSR